MVYVSFAAPNAGNNNPLPANNFQAIVDKAPQKIPKKPTSATQFLPENGNFNNIVAMTKDLPPQYRSARYSSLRDDLKGVTPIMAYGRLLFVVPKSSNINISICKFKKLIIDIQLSLLTMNCNPTARRILASAREKGMPIVVVINDNGSCSFGQAEDATSPQNKIKLQRNYDILRWSPYGKRPIYKNPNGSISRSPSWVGLTHELGHAEYCHKTRKDYLKNPIADKKLEFGFAKKYVSDFFLENYDGTDYEESRNIINEQKAMREAGLTPRQFYKVSDYKTVDVTSPLEIPQ